MRRYLIGPHTLNFPLRILVDGRPASLPYPSMLFDLWQGCQLQPLLEIKHQSIPKGTIRGYAVQADASAFVALETYGWASFAPEEPMVLPARITEVIDGKTRYEPWKALIYWQHVRAVTIDSFCIMHPHEEDVILKASVSKSEPFVITKLQALSLVGISDCGLTLTNGSVLTGEPDETKYFGLKLLLNGEPVSAENPLPNPDSIVIAPPYIEECGFYLNLQKGEKKELAWGEITEPF